MTFPEIDPRENLKEVFSDTFTQAEEYITDGKLSADDVAVIMLEAFTEWRDYYKKCANVYDQMFDALTRQFRNQ